MRIHRQNGVPEPPAGRGGNTTDARPGGSGGDHAVAGTAGPPRQTSGAAASSDQTTRVQAAPGETMATAMQLAIALLTAGLDSPELEAWAADTLTPIDAEGLGDFMAGLHVISVLLLNELHEATGEPRAAILQKLAILAERRRGTPSAG